MAETRDWSPDGRQVLAIINNQIVLISLTDGSTRILKTLGQYYPWTANFSPDGRYIVYSHPPDDDSRGRDIFLLSVDDGRETPLVQHPADDFVLGWSPDGWVLFGSDRTGALGFWAVEVAGGKPQGTPQLVKPGVTRVAPLGFTRRGSFYYGYQGSRSDIYTAKVDPRTGEVLAPPKKATTRLEGFNYEPSYSPDGKSLAYVTRRDNSVYPLGAGNVLSIHSFDSGKDREIYSELVRMNLRFVARPRWSPDGRSILLRGEDSQGEDGLYLFKTQTGLVTPVLRCERGVRVGGLEWSQGGRSFFYWRVEQKGKGPQQILVRDLESGQEKELYRAPWPEGLASIAVSPDGRWLSFLNRADKRVLGLIPASGGTPRELFKFDHPGNQSVHPGGQEIAFVQRSSGASAVWVMENFLPALKADR
jgi:Tol biopolymer transport system component